MAGLTQVWHGMLYICTNMATVGVSGLRLVNWLCAVGVSLCFRWRWSRMSLMISSVTSARVLAAVASLLRSSVPVWRASSTTVSSVGCRFTRGLAASTTSLLSRKAPIARALFHSAGAEPYRSIAVQYLLLFPGFSMVSFYFYRREV